MEVIHRNERGHDRNRQRYDGNQRGTEVEQKHNNDQADDDRLFDQVSLQGLNRVLNQAGAVITRDHFNSRRQGGFDFRQFLFDAVDYIECVQAKAHHHNPADRFALSLPFRYTFSNVRAE